MTLVALGGKSYKTFLDEFWEFFRAFPGGMNLWTRFTFLNPFEFYRFHDEDIIKNLSSALEEAECDTDKLKDNLEKMKRMQQEFKKQREKLKKHGNA